MLRMITTTGSQLPPVKNVSGSLRCRHRSSSTRSGEVVVYLAPTNDDAECIDAPPSKPLICGA